MNIALIFAGGTGSRMNNTSSPKQFLSLYNKPIIIYTLEHFEEHPSIDGIIISCIKSWIPHLKALLKQFNIKKVRSIVPGGRTGQESIFNGLVSTEKYFHKDSIILIHDAVRPILTEQLITDNINSVIEFGNAVTSALPTETPLQVDKNNNIDIVHQRDIFRVAKAPQSFKLADILSIHRQAREEKYNNAIDSSSLMLKYGVSIKLVEGSSSNIKITTPTDYFIFKALIDAHYEKQLSTNHNTFKIQ